MNTRKSQKFLLYVVVILLPGIFYNASYSQDKEVSMDEINPEILNKTWEALWITHPTASLVDFGVFHFRNSFELSQNPEEFIVHVSADNRYELYVNGSLVTLGPAWSDLLHWRFESVDIAQYLRKGKNVIAARVVNFGDERAVSQYSFKTGFLLQGNGELESIANTSTENWRVMENHAYKPIHIDWKVFPYYYATFSTDTFDVVRHPYGWNEQAFDDGDWLSPAMIGYSRKGTPRGGGHYFSDQSAWLLEPRSFPLLTSDKQRFPEVERTENIDVHDAFIKGSHSITIPANTEVSILLDHEVHTRAYPELLFSGGKGSTVKIEYVESLVDDEGIQGNRNITHGKHTLGYYDVILPDGTKNRSYRPLWVRVFRYVELQIKTGDDPLELHDFYTYYTAYPYERKAAFISGQPKLDDIVPVAWRTLRNATAEVFEDGPYFEQLMYAGDARIASLVSMYLSGDERMTKNAIDLFNNSRMPEGLTYARYPSNQVQINPQYSLSWVQMIYDYFRIGSDPAYVKKYLRGIEGVLLWHEQLVDSTGMLGEVPFLRHIEAKSKTPMHPERGHSAQQTLFYALTLDYASQLFEYFGHTNQAEHYRNLSKQLEQVTYRLCYDPDRGLFADTPQKDVYTQHANTLAVLNEMMDPEQQKKIMHKVLNDSTLMPAYLFFKFYVFQALDKAGMGDRLIEEFELWKELLDYGFTTFPEFDFESRSDCHPWSTHPAYFLFSTVAGIKPLKPGFEQVEIAPHWAELEQLEVTMPHHTGEIKMKMTRNSYELNVELTLPETLQGQFLWDGKSRAIKGGYQKFRLKVPNAKDE